MYLLFPQLSSLNDIFFSCSHFKETSSALLGSLDLSSEKNPGKETMVPVFIHRHQEVLLSLLVIFLVAFFPCYPVVPRSISALWRDCSREPIEAQLSGFAPGFPPIAPADNNMLRVFDPSLFVDCPQTDFPRGM